MSILPKMALALLSSLAATAVSAQDLFHVDQARMTAAAREVLRQQEPELADSELPLISIMIVCNDTEGKPCTGAVQLATAADESVTRKGQRCITKTAYTTVQVAIMPNGETFVPESRGTSSKTTISECSRTSQPGNQSDSLL